MTLEMGKALAESKAEIVYAAEFFRWFSGEALRIDGHYKDAGNRASRVLVMRQPVGPCYFVTPWNFPTAMGTRKIGPAIAAGCTMVWKPAQLTPLSMLALAELLGECGLPRGVLNVITSSSSSAVAKPIIEDPRLRKLSFTGSTEVGRKLIAQSSRQRSMTRTIRGSLTAIVSPSNVASTSSRSRRSPASTATDTGGCHHDPPARSRMLS